MDPITAAIRWLADPANWGGASGILVRLLEHIEVSALSLLVATLLALPAGLAIGHARRGVWLAVNLANAARAVPSYAVLSIAFVFTVQALPQNGGLDFWPTIIAMIALAIPSILINTYVGIEEVDRDTVDAARGMGMREREILTRVEMPLALPAIFGGLRSAAVQVVATATLGAILGLGGLGRFIVDGFAQQDDGQLFGGVVLVAALALAAEGALALAERVLVSPGLSRRGAPVAMETPATGPLL